MNDINLTLRQAYHDILKGSIEVKGEVVPVYYQLVPGGYPSAYILIQSISSTGNESKTNQQRKTSIQFVISTRYDINSSFECDYIAGRVLDMAYGYRGQVIPGCESMDLVSDLSNGSFDPGAKKQIQERIITFSHLINN